MDAMQAGEPVRIVLSGFVADEEHPYALGGGSILDKRRYAKENCDDVRGHLSVVKGCIHFVFSFYFPPSNCYQSFEA